MPDNAPITLLPLRNERDYEAAMERLEELTEAQNRDDEASGGDSAEEIEVLQTLIEHFEERESITEDPEDFELLPRLPDPETVALVVFNLSNGNEIRLVGRPDNGELAVAEISDAGVEDFLLDERWHPNAIFQRFSPKKYPVPRMLIRLDATGAFEGRKVVDAIAEPIEIDLERLGVQPVQAVAGGGSCQPGPAGATYFEDHHCGTLGGPGYGASESYCYEAAYEWVQKTSGLRRATYTRMAACGSSPCRVRHFYKTLSGYHTQLSVDVQPHKVISHWSAKKGVRRRRRVRFEAVRSGGWVRGWVKFHSQVADGWF